MGTLGSSWKTAFFASSAGTLLLTTTPLTAFAEDDLTITNRSSQQIVAIYISPPGDGKWGEDWLAAAKYGFLVPGDHAMFRITLGCKEDIEVTYMDKHSQQWSAFDTCKSDLADRLSRYEFR